VLADAVPLVPVPLVPVPLVPVPLVPVPLGEEDAEVPAVGSDNAAGVLPLKKWM
jgi:hypothetical protein